VPVNAATPVPVIVTDLPNTGTTTTTVNYSDTLFAIAAIIAAIGAGLVGLGFVVVYYFKHEDV
jgi:hypothetical protein